MQTHSGRQFWPIDPRPDEIDLEDIAHALSHLCRFAGHVQCFYSVAEHSIRVSYLAWAEKQDKRLALAALLHDATEAYVVDVPRPLKRFLSGYAEIESRVARCVEQRFDLETGILDHPLIKQWDEVLLATEARDLMGGQSAGKWHLRAEPLGQAIRPIAPADAKASFLACFGQLTS